MPSRLSTSTYGSRADTPLSNRQTSDGGLSDGLALTDASTATDDQPGWLSTVDVVGFAIHPHDVATASRRWCMATSPIVAVRTGRAGHSAPLRRRRQLSSIIGPLLSLVVGTFYGGLMDEPAWEGVVVPARFGTVQGRKRESPPELAR
jgi:hypothetical protein